MIKINPMTLTPETVTEYEFSRVNIEKIKYYSEFEQEVVKLEKELTAFKIDYHNKLSHYVDSVSDFLLTVIKDSTRIVNDSGNEIIDVSKNDVIELLQKDGTIPSVYLVSEEYSKNVVVGITLFNHKLVDFNQSDMKFKMILRLYFD